MIVAPKDIHSLMVYAQLMIFIIFVWTIDVVEIKHLIIKIGLKIFVCSILLLTLVMYSRFNNKCYMQADFAHSQAISYFTTLTTQIKSVDGYKDDLAVTFINAGKITDRTIYEFNQFKDINLSGYGDAVGYVND